MARKRNGQIHELSEVQRRFEEWRQTRRGKTRIPEELWSAAVEVARQGGVSRTAAALHLDGGKLMKRLRASKVARKKMAPPAFVELVTAGAGNSAEYVIELEDGDGAGLRIHCKGISATDLAALCRALRSAAA